VAGDALRHRIVDAVDGELVVRRQHLPHGRFLEDEVGTVRARRRTGRDDDRRRTGRGSHEKSTKRHACPPAVLQDHMGSAGCLHQPSPPRGHNHIGKIINY